LAITNFTSIEELNTHIQKEKKGSILIEYRNLENYDGMVLCIIMRFDTEKNKYELQLEWECLGLDFYGDTLQESYWYLFGTLQQMLDYLQTKYNIAVTDIPVKYSFDSSRFANMLRDEAKRPQFEEAWQRFQKDFKSGVFLDPLQTLVYTSTERHSN